MNADALATRLGMRTRSEDSKCLILEYMLNFNRISKK